MRQFQNGMLENLLLKLKFKSKLNTGPSKPGDSQDTGPRSAGMIPGVSPRPSEKVN